MKGDPEDSIGQRTGVGKIMVQYFGTADRTKINYISGRQNILRLLLSSVLWQETQDSVCHPLL